MQLLLRTVNVFQYIILARFTTSATGVGVAVICFDLHQWVPGSSEGIAKNVL